MKKPKNEQKKMYCIDMETATAATPHPLYAEEKHKKNKYTHTHRLFQVSIIWKRDKTGLKWHSRQQMKSWNMIEEK